MRLTSRVGSGCGKFPATLRTGYKKATSRERPLQRYAKARSKAKSIGTSVLLFSLRLGIDREFTESGFPAIVLGCGYRVGFYRMSVRSFHATHVVAVAFIACIFQICRVGSDLQIMGIGCGILGRFVRTPVKTYVSRLLHLA